MPQVRRRKSLCVEIVERIAEAEGIDPVDVTPPLSEVIDLEALESLFAGKQVEGHAVFSYRGYQIGVDGNGNVELETGLDGCR